MTKLVMPQRIIPFAHGAAFAASAVKLRENEHAHARPDHLALIRQCPCLKCGLDPAGEAAHVRLNSAAAGKRQAMGRKPNDSWTVPLCRACHVSDPDALHRIGEREFWDRIGIGVIKAAQRLYAATGDLVAMRAVALSIIGERGR